MVIRVKSHTIKRTIKTETIVVEITDETITREIEIAITEIQGIETLERETQIIVEGNNHNVKSKTIVISDDLLFTQMFLHRLVKSHNFMNIFFEILSCHLSMIRIEFL